MTWWKKFIRIEREPTHTYWKTTGEYLEPEKITETEYRKRKALHELDLQLRGKKPQKPITIYDKAIQELRHAK